MSMPERYLRPKEVSELLGMSTRTFWRKVKTEEGFPQPIKEGNRALVASSEVIAYQQRKFQKTAA